MITLTVFILILLILILLKRLCACFANGCQVRALLGNPLHGCRVLDLLLGKLSLSIHRFVNTEPEGVCSSGSERGEQLVQDISAARTPSSNLAEFLTCLISCRSESS